MSEPEKAWDFLEQAVKEMKGRKELYDPDKESDGERSMGKTVEMFNTLTDNELTEEQGWMFMVCLKMVRSQSGKYQADDYVDGSAYFALGGESAKKGRSTSGLGDELVEMAKNEIKKHHKPVEQVNFYGFACSLCGYLVAGEPSMFKNKKPVCGLCFKNGINPVPTGDPE